MRIKKIELYHPEVNDGKVETLYVYMTAIYCSPPDDIGRSKMDPIEITVPLRSDQHYLLDKFEKASGDGPSGIIPTRLATGDHVGLWSIVGHQFTEYEVGYSLVYSGEDRT